MSFENENDPTPIPADKNQEGFHTHHKSTPSSSSQIQAHDKWVCL